TQPLNRKWDMCKIRNRAMPILEVKRIQELLGPLRADLGKRLLHRQRRARILSHRIGQHFRVGSVNRINIGLIRFRFVLGHGTSEYVMVLRMFRPGTPYNLGRRYYRRFMTIAAGRIALITGASQGIGRACALELARSGASVALAARNLEKLAVVAAEITAAGGTAHAFALDVSSEESIKECAKSVIAH